MNEMSSESKIGAAVALAHSALDDAAAAELGLDARDDFLAAYRELERLRNRIASVEHAFVLEVERRSLAFELGATSLPALVAQLLRLTRPEASARVRAAQAAGPRTTLLGEPRSAEFEQVAAAQAAGVMSPAQAAVVVKTVNRLPDAVQEKHAAGVEAELVAYADQFDAHGLGTLAERITAHLDPDGKFSDVEHRRARRDFVVSVRPDGSSRVRGDWTAELTARALVFFDALAGPTPEVDGVKDSRTAGQRKHDALLDGLDLIQRAGLLPSVNGVSATVVLHMSDQAWRTGHGIATTGHGAVVPAAEALRWAGGDARIMAVLFNSIRDVTAASGLQRLFTERQRLIFTARDIGCTFPGCDAPAPRCQAHHLDDWADGGPTTVHNGGLVCAHDHRERIRQGWTTKLINGRVGWIPPSWLDQTRTPRFNYAHRPATI